RPFLSSVVVLPRPPRTPLFPYTTLFRSGERLGSARVELDDHLDVARHGDLGAHGATREDRGELLDLHVEVRRDLRELVRTGRGRSEEHTSELQSRENLVCRLLLEKKQNN